MIWSWFQKWNLGVPLVVQWRIHPAMQRTQAQVLFGELRSHRPQGQKKKKKGYLSRLSGWGLGGGLLAVVRNFVWLLIMGIWNNGLNKIEDIFSFFFLLHLSLPLPFREIEGSPGQVWRLTITRGLGYLPLSCLLGTPYHGVSFLVVTSWEKMELSHYLHITDSCLSPGRNLLSLH